MRRREGSESGPCRLGKAFKNRVIVGLEGDPENDPLKNDDFTTRLAFSSSRAEMKSAFDGVQFSSSSC